MLYWKANTVSFYSGFVGGQDELETILVELERLEKWHINDTHYILLLRGIWIPEIVWERKEYGNATATLPYIMKCRAHKYIKYKSMIIADERQDENIL